MNLCKIDFDHFEIITYHRLVWREHQEQPVQVNHLRRRLRGLFLCWLGNHRTCKITKNSNCPGLYMYFFVRRVHFRSESGNRKWSKNEKSWFWWFNRISDINKQSENANSIPFIQKYGKIRIRDARNPSRKRQIEIRISKYLFPALMTNWLLSYRFCDAFLNSKSASIIEALNSSCKWNGLKLKMSLNWKKWEFLFQSIILA